MLVGCLSVIFCREIWVANQSFWISVETNSCPSGQKSMPLLQDVQDEYGGYGVVVEHTLKPLLAKTDKAVGDIAVVFDKNAMENR